MRALLKDEHMTTWSAMKHASNSAVSENGVNITNIYPYIIGKFLDCDVMILHRQNQHLMHGCDTKQMLEQVHQYNILMQLSGWTEG